MAYYKDITILVYVRRGAFTVTQCERNVEKFNMLKVLMATAFRDVEHNVKTLCRDYSFDWNEDRGWLKISMPRARWEKHFSEKQELEQAWHDLSSAEHQYCVEYAVIDPDNVRNCFLHVSKNIQNPLLSIEAKVKVSV